MVRITSALAFLAMGTSIMANPVASEQNLVARADLGDKTSAAGAIADVVDKVVQLVQGMIDDDLARRRTFTQNTAKDVAAQFPGHSVIVCNVGYSLSGSGDQLVYSTSYNAKVGSDVTFDVIVFKSPKTFDRRGDGGYENWAFYVDASCNENGGHVECL
ncbi:hypothetical protein AA0115_g11564 [Alternaria tenuissima]|uniref:DUF7888 domain-containing protein n=1 Tax=Alternaria tenuissima TaxID=119927 RepID=A0AB37W416_9PLEO|nr:hypothetical protein AA0115_g11564 [Alternaria tenuissima]